MEGSAVVAAHRPDREKLASLARDQNRFVTHVSQEHAAVRNGVGRNALREVRPGCRRLLCHKNDEVRSRELLPPGTPLFALPGSRVVSSWAAREGDPACRYAARPFPASLPTQSESPGSATSCPTRGQCTPPAA